MSAVRHAYIISKWGNGKASPFAMPRREQYMWRVSDKYTKKPFSQLKQAELHGIFGKRSAAEYTKKGLEQMRVP